MIQESHIFLSSPLLNSNNHDNNTMHLTIDMTTREVVVVEGIDIEEAIKVVDEDDNTNVLIMVIFITNNMSVHILKHS